MLGPDVVGALSEPVDQGIRRAAASGRGSHTAQVVLPSCAGSGGEHGRGDRRQLRVQRRRQRHRAQNQVRMCFRDGLQIRRTARTHTGRVMHRPAEVGRLTRRSVGRRRGDDPGLQAQGTQRIELVAGEHHDALRISGYLGQVRGDARGVARRAGRRPRIGRGRVPCARLVGLAVIAQHPGARNLGGWRDHRPRRCRGRFVGAAGGARQDRRGHGHGGQAE